MRAIRVLWHELAAEGLSIETALEDFALSVKGIAPLAVSPKNRGWICRSRCAAFHSPLLASTS